MALYTSKSNSIITSYTLTEFMQYKDGNNATYSNFAIFAKSITNSDLIYGISNVLEEYMDDIKQYAKTIVFTKEEVVRYKYRPKLLSYDIYGNTECDWVLLLLNGMCNAKEFSLYNEQLQAFTPTDLNSILSQILQGETTYMRMNKQYVGIITD